MVLGEAWVSFRRRARACAPSGLHRARSCCATPPLREGVGVPRLAGLVDCRLAASLVVRLLPGRLVGLGSFPDAGLVARLLSVEMVGRVLTAGLVAHLLAVPMLGRVLTPGLMLRLSAGRLERWCLLAGEVAPLLANGPGFSIVFRTAAANLLPLRWGCSLVAATEASTLCWGIRESMHKA